MEQVDTHGAQCPTEDHVFPTPAWDAELLVSVVGHPSNLPTPATALPAPAGLSLLQFLDIGLGDMNKVMSQKYLLPFGSPQSDSLVPSVSRANCGKG